MRLLHVMQTQRRFGAQLYIWKNDLSSYTYHWSKIYKYRGFGQCGSVQLIWRTIGQGPTGLAVGADGDCMSLLSPSLENGSKLIEILAQGTVKPKAITNQLHESLIYFFILIYLFI